MTAAQQAALLRFYKRARKEGRIAEGYDWGVFVTYDAGVQERWASAELETLVPVWYADWEAGKVDRFGFTGALAMRPEMVWRGLLPKLVRGDKEPLEGLHMMASER